MIHQINKKILYASLFVIVILIIEVGCFLEIVQRYIVKRPTEQSATQLATLTGDSLQRDPPQTCQ